MIFLKNLFDFEYWCSVSDVRLLMLNVWFIFLVKLIFCNDSVISDGKDIVGFVISLLLCLFVDFLFFGFL